MQIVRGDYFDWGFDFNDDGELAYSEPEYDNETC